MATPDVELALHTLREVATAYRGEAAGEVVVAEGPPAPEIVARLVHAGVAVHEARRSRTNLEDLFARLDGGVVSESGGRQHAEPAGRLSAASEPTAQNAPIGRLLGSEVRWVLRRPRTLVMLALFALMPVTIAIGVVASNRSRRAGRQHRRQRARPARRRADPRAGAAAAARRRDGGRRRARRRGRRGHPARPAARPRVAAAAGGDEGVRGAGGRGARHRRDRGRRRARGRGAGRRRRRAGHPVGHHRRRRRRAVPDRCSPSPGRSDSSPRSARSRSPSRRGRSTRWSCSRACWAW